MTTLFSINNVQQYVGVQHSNPCGCNFTICHTTAHISLVHSYIDIHKYYTNPQDIYLYSLAANCHVQLIGLVLRKSLIAHL